jgi:hypothetical protein
MSDKDLVHNFGMELLRLSALKSAAYFEDVVSQWGLFDGFRKLNRKLCGNTLPFYTLDKDYYDDEINLLDIQFLVWSTMQEQFNEMEKDFVINPENPGIEIISRLILYVLEEEYETAPENETIYHCLQTAEFDDFFEFRRLLHWLYYNSYLSTNYPNRHLAELKKELSKKRIKDLPMPYDQLVYLTECNRIFTNTCTPLAVNAIDWLKEITRNTHTVKKIESIDFRPYSMYKIMENDDEIIHLLPFGENQPMLQLARNSLADSDRRSAKIFDSGKECLQSALVFFDGLWQVNGMLAYAEMDETVLASENKKNENRNRRETNQKYNYEELMKQTNGEPLVFFKDFSEWKKFWLQTFPKTSNSDEMLKGTPIIHKKNLTLFVSKKEAASILTDVAPLIKMPGNKLYNKTDAERFGIALLSGAYPVSLEMFEYLINNKLIPDVSIHSEKGAAYGNKLIQDNLWFVLRFFQPKLFARNFFEVLPDYDKLDAEK